ncbi:MAG: hypothetical protein LW832_01965 [Parachlamydia sp.]|jgi:hypothetical protein|nr:hypothetical protein [Parachlamydia sp.]
MVLQVFNNIYTNCSSYGNRTIEFSKPIVNKIAEMAKQCFKSIGQFALGFCIGTAATTCYTIFQSPPMGYSLDLYKLAVSSVAGGIFVGIGMAVKSWRGEAV